MEWTREKTLILINEYRKRRELWDMTHEDYRKKDMKTKYLNEVSKNLGGDIPTVEIEKKFHTLRTQFHREVNRIKRKDAYNSKWFAFKSLQFLSSPKACRSNKGRIKSEITEEGTVTTKYIITEAGPHETSGGSINSSSTIQDEFLTIHRKPSYEAASARGNTATQTTSRSQELEKLIEETTKDVQEIEEPKPKLTIKDVNMPMETLSHNFEHHDVGMNNDEAEAMQTDDEQHQQQVDDDEVEPIESIAIQGTDGEITYHQTNPTQTIHALPRIIKIQRRDTINGHEEDYYDPQTQHQQQPQHLHALPANAKRIYYNTNGQQHTATILTPATPTNPPNNTTTILSTSTQHRASIPSQSQSPSSGITQNTSRDEYSTYGEYVANEMRNITSREVLAALKHKINTALFEASMAELQKGLK